MKEIINLNFNNTDYKVEFRLCKTDQAPLFFFQFDKSDLFQNVCL